MVLPTAASAVVIKRKRKYGNDELRGNDDGKSYDPSAAVVIVAPRSVAFRGRLIIRAVAVCKDCSLYYEEEAMLPKLLRRV
jgi:hypothetical protein